MALFLIFGSKIVLATSGCCSYHGGENRCDYDVGREICNDTQYSPTCTCPIIQIPSCNIAVDPSEITWGDSASLSWNSYSANLMSSSNFGATGLDGSKSINPLTDTSFNMFVRNIRGTVSCTASIKVDPKIEVKQDIVKQEIKLDDTIIKNDSWPTWRKTTIDNGVIGSKDLVYKITFTNNVQTSKEKTAENIKVKPKSKVMEVGTKNFFAYYFGALKNIIVNHKLGSISILILLVAVALVLIFKRDNLKKLLKNKKG